MYYRKPEKVAPLHPNILLLLDTLVGGERIIWRFAFVLFSECLGVSGGKEEEKTGTYSAQKRVFIGTENKTRVVFYLSLLM